MSLILLTNTHYSLEVRAEGVINCHNLKMHDHSMITHYYSLCYNCNTKEQILLIHLGILLRRGREGDDTIPNFSFCSIFWRQLVELQLLVKIGYFISSYSQVHLGFYCIYLIFVPHL